MDPENAMRFLGLAIPLEQSSGVLREFSPVGPAISVFHPGLHLRSKMQGIEPKDEMNKL